MLVVSRKGDFEVVTGPDRWQILSGTLPSFLGGHQKYDSRSLQLALERDAVLFTFQTFAALRNTIATLHGTGESS